ncbi:Translin [Phialemonium atrogriseum]|uniref:Translin n=1 Tax=Phialemonium atrogriseum TaxID=1093897 RepID=A0AAJ0FKC5_9PEZI|nr:Translin [Phialemonium atrogriseum]KAK1770922.1 Translin [Phialemonium atrogriseum]
MPPTMIDPLIFDLLKSKLEEETKIRQDLSQIVEQLERHVSYAQGVLSRVHSTPRSEYPTFLGQAEAAIKDELKTVTQLSEFASKYPYYKYNFKWTRNLQDAIFTVIFTAWLGGLSSATKQGELGRLLTLEEVGDVFQVPVNVKDSDAFHITIEEYLLALTNVTEELSRLATNAVTLGDHELAVRISSFVKDIHAGFQLLNLKNDVLRKKVDGVKYHVKKVEDVVYDLSVRNLIPTGQSG